MANSSSGVVLEGNHEACGIFVQQSELLNGHPVFRSRRGLFWLFHDASAWAIKSASTGANVLSFLVLSSSSSGIGSVLGQERWVDPVVGAVPLRLREAEPHEVEACELCEQNVVLHVLRERLELDSPSEPALQPLVGSFMARPKWVNSRPVYRHTNGKYWMLFDQATCFWTVVLKEDGAVVLRGVASKAFLPSQVWLWQHKQPSGYVDCYAVCVSLEGQTPNFPTPPPPPPIAPPPQQPSPPAAQAPPSSNIPVLASGAPVYSRSHSSKQMRPPVLAPSRSNSMQGAKLLRNKPSPTTSNGSGNNNNHNNAAATTPVKPVPGRIPASRRSVTTAPPSRPQPRSRSSTTAVPTPPITRTSNTSNNNNIISSNKHYSVPQNATNSNNTASSNSNNNKQQQQKAPVPPKGAPPPKSKVPKPLPCKPLTAAESKAFRDGKDASLCDVVVAGWPPDLNYARGPYLVQDWLINQRPAYLNDEFLLYHDGHAWRIRDTTTHGTIAVTPSKATLPLDSEDANRQWAVGGRPHPKLSVYLDHSSPYPCYFSRARRMFQFEASGRGDENGRGAVSALPKGVPEVVLEGLKKGSVGYDLLGVYTPVVCFNGRPAYRRADMWLLYDGTYWMIRSGSIPEPSSVAGRLRAFVYDKAEAPTSIAIAWTGLKIDTATLSDAPLQLRIEPVLGVDVKESDWTWVDVVMTDTGRMKSKEDNEMLGVYTTLTHTTLPHTIPCPPTCTHNHTLPNQPQQQQHSSSDYVLVNHRPMLARGAFFLLYDPSVGWCVRSGYDCIFALIADSSRSPTPAPPNAIDPISSKLRRCTKAFARSDACHPTEITCAWSVGEGGVNNRTLTVAPLRASDSEQFLKQDAEERGAMLVQLKQGASNATSVERDLEGTYHRVKGERLNGRNVYWTREPQDMWLVFDGARWAVGDRRDGGGLKRMVMRSDASVPSQARGTWTVHTSTGYQPSTSLTVTAIEPTGPAALAVKGPSVLEEIAGVYQPLLEGNTAVLHNKRPVFLRPAPSSHTRPLLLLHEANAWAVYSGITTPAMLGGGKVRRRMYVVSEAEHPTEVVQGEWVIVGEEGAASQRTTLVNITEATREDHVSDAISRKVREEEERSDVLVAGPQGECIGLYRKQRTVFDDRPVYRRQAYWLFHDMDSWVIRSGIPHPQNARGTTHYTTPSAAPLPTRCPNGQWLAFENAKFVPAPTVKVSIATVLDVEAEIAREAKRRAEVTCDIRIRGLEGDEDCSGAMGVYQRTGKGVGRGIYVKGEYELSFEGSKWSLLHSEFRSPVMYAVDQALAPCHVTEKWRVREDNRFRVSTEVVVEAVWEEEEEEEAREKEPDVKQVVVGAGRRPRRQPRGSRANQN